MYKYMNTKRPKPTFSILKPSSPWRPRTLRNPCPRLATSWKSFVNVSLIAKAVLVEQSAHASDLIRSELHVASIRRVIHVVVNWIDAGRGRARVLRRLSRAAVCALGFKGRIGNVIAVAGTGVPLEGMQ